MGRMAGGTNILAPAVDVDNENPSLVALGKNLAYNSANMAPLCQWGLLAPLYKWGMVVV